MSDNLKEMQAAFEEWAGYSAEFNPSAWKAWQAAIASQQAAHEAEIARLKEEMRALRTECASNMVELIGTQEKISAANAACAMKDEVLNDFYNSHSETYSASPEGRAYLKKIKQAISATPQQVSEWERKQLEPLRNKISELEANERSYEQIIGQCTYQEVADKMFALSNEVATLRDALVVLNNFIPVGSSIKALEETQATAEQFIAECEQRGAVKALEDAAKEAVQPEWMGQGTDKFAVYLLRATSKKAG